MALRSEMHTIAADLEAVKAELTSSLQDFENYKKKTRLATIKLQQQLATASSSQDIKTSDLQAQVTACQQREKELTEEIAQNQEMINGLHEELQMKNELMESMEKQTEAMRTVLREVENELDTLRVDKKTVEMRVSSLESEKQAMMEAMEVLESQKREKEEMLKQLATSPEEKKEMASMTTSPTSVGEEEEEEEEMEEKEQMPEEKPIMSEIGTNSLLRVLEDSNEETVGLFHLPHKEMEAMHEELVSLRASLANAEK